MKAYNLDNIAGGNVRKHRIIALDQVVPDQQHLTQNCFYCSCPKHSKKKKAVMAVEVEIPYNANLYFGICGNHAEVYPLTEEEKQMRPMLCPDCFPRGNSRYDEKVRES